MKVISVAPLTRVEGYGRVELHVADGRLQRVHLRLLEAPRLLESALRGRSFLEVPALVCRICSVCSAVHRIAAASAIENGLRIKIPSPAEKVRELLLLGGHIESHALHLFCLIYPDLCGVDHILDLLAKGDRCIKGGLELKRIGNRIQEVAGGRAIHPPNVEVGGIVALPSASNMNKLLQEIMVFEKELPELLKPFKVGNYPPAGAAAGIRMAVTKRGEEGFTLQGDTLNLSDGRSLSVSHCGDYLLDGRFCGTSARNSVAETFLTGALARQEIYCQQVGRVYESEVAGIHANCCAQADELGWALARCRILLNELLELAAGVEICVPVPCTAGIGIAIVEAPRGLLIHRYVLDNYGEIAEAGFLTPTAVNQRAISEQLLADLRDVREEALPVMAERIIRAYDPCISCAVHVRKV